MAYTDHIAGPILAAHLKDGELIPGTEIGIGIDQTLTQDATGTLVYLEFMSLGIDYVRTSLSVSYVDHNTLQTGYENADDHLFLQPTAARYDLYFYHPDKITIHMGNIKPLPELEPMPNSLRLKLLLKIKDNITTDDILPGEAKVLPLRSNLPAISEYVFASKGPEFAERAKIAGPVAILGGKNYGNRHE